MPVIETSTLPSDQGFKILGGVANGLLGTSGVACDLDGDGFDELIVGALGAFTYRGMVYVLWGGIEGPLFPNSTASITPPLGFSLAGVANIDQTGCSLACVDANQDGYKDIIIGARGARPGGKSAAGAVYVLFQDGTRNQTNINLGSIIANPSQGFIISGENANEQFGFSVGNAGDVNGDGWKDIVVGAPYANANNGNAYVLYSKPGLNALDLAKLNATSGFKLLGTGTFSATTGYAVNGIGDINGDGFDEVAIGAKRHGGANKGAVYVVFGKPSRSTPVNLSTDLVANDLIRFDGTSGDQPRLGWAVSSAGNFNGDRFTDFIFSAPFASSPMSTSAGAAYIIFGKANFSDTTIPIASLSLNDGFTVYSSKYSALGYSLSGGRDINGDDLDDVVIGSPGYMSQKGTCYVVYGTTNASSIIYAGAMTAQQGYQLVRGSNSISLIGQYGTILGNFNNDKLTDIVVNGPRASENGLTNSGMTIGIYGNSIAAPVLVGSSGNLDYNTDSSTSVVINPGIVVSDSDSANMFKAQVSISSGFKSGDLLGFTNQNGISGQYKATTGELTLTGTASKAAYQAALRTVTYQSSSTTVDTRTISFIVNDATNNSNVVTRQLTLVPLNHLLGGESEELLCLNQVNQQTIFPQLTIAGGTTVTLQNAKVTITNFVAGEESLVFTNLGNGVSGNFNSATGILTLTGPASANAFKATLLTVKYRNTNANTASSLKSFDVALGFAGQTSTPLESQLNIITIDDAPVVINPVADFNVTANQPFLKALSNNTFSQPASNLSLSVKEGGGALTSLSYNDKSNVLSGTLAQAGLKQFSLFATESPCNLTATSNFKINVLLATTTSTGTSTNTHTNTATGTSTNTHTNTATATGTSTNTLTNTATGTATNTHTNTATGTSTNTHTNTATATNTYTNTATVTSTATNTLTNTITVTNSATNTVTATPSNLPINVLTATLTPTAIMTPTAIPSLTPTSTLMNMSSSLIPSNFSTATPASSASSHGSDDETGAIVGGVIGGVAAVVCLGGCIGAAALGLFAWQKKREQDKSAQIKGLNLANAEF